MKIVDQRLNSFKNRVDNSMKSNELLKKKILEMKLYIGEMETSVHSYSVATNLIANVCQMANQNSLNELLTLSKKMDDQHESRI